MALLNQLFSADDLRALDAKDLATLKAAISNEINTSPQIRDLLRAKAHQVYSQLKPGTTPQGPGQP